MRSPPSAPAIAKPFRRKLLRWFQGRQRDLPWRRTRDPYAIVVSEFMLQQTQVKAVIPYYRRFLKRFPDLRSLAAAGEQDVLHAWAGLGYYRRARQLHRFAAATLERHSGVVPDRPEPLRALPGFGPYTAAAVASIAFGRACAVVDGNVARVLCRLFREGGDPSAGATRRRLAERAQALLAPRRPGDFNQAIMELGALVCRPKAPRCGECPVRSLCGAFCRREQERYPAPRKRPRILAVAEWAPIVLRRGKILLIQRGDNDRWSGMWEIPHAEARPGEDLETGAARVAKALSGLRLGSVTPAFTVRYAFTRYRFEAQCAWGRAAAGRTRLSEHQAFCWVAPDRLESYPLPSPHRRIARRILQELARGTPG